MSVMDRIAELEKLIFFTKMADRYTEADRENLLKWEKELCELRTADGK